MAKARGDSIAVHLFQAKCPTHEKCVLRGVKELHLRQTLQIETIIQCGNQIFPF